MIRNFKLLKLDNQVELDNVRYGYQSFVDKLVELYGLSFYCPVCNSNDMIVTCDLQDVDSYSGILDTELWIECNECESLLIIPINENFPKTFNNYLRKSPSPEDEVDKWFTENNLVKSEPIGNQFKYLTEYDEESWKISCDCRDQQCDLDLFLEPVGDTNLYELYMCGNLLTTSHDDNPLKSLWNRIKYVCQILFEGCIEIHSSLILNRENVKSLIYVLNKVKDKIVE